MRVALYARVSSEEQVRGGISLDAQLEALKKWAEGHCIVGEYVDPGISARKPPIKRPALQQLLADIPTKKIELIIFTKLDRWTRNVKGYYQVQDILDKYKVVWNAIQEDYETATASGRMKVNIMLSVAENEADRTGERIKAIHQYKIAMGESINASVPLGYKIADKRIVPDDNAHIVRKAFELYAKTGNKANVRTMLREQYGIVRDITNVTRMLKNPLYAGRYKENNAFCEAIIPPQLYDRVQDIMASRYSKITPSGRSYLFSGLIQCAECGHRFAAINNHVGVNYYRCPIHYNKNACANAKYVREDELETACLAQIAELVKDKKAAAPVKEPPINKAAVNQKLNRLKELYIEGDIDRTQYLNRKNELTALLDVKPSVKPQIALGNDFAELYGKLSAENKKAYWRQIIDHITAYPNGDIDVFFSTSVY